MTAFGIGTDIGLIIVALIIAAAGWRRGALVSVVSLAGFLGGIWVGGRLLSPLLDKMSANDWPLSNHPMVVAFVVLLGCALILQAVGHAISGAIRRHLGDGVVGGFDSLGGAVVSVVAVGLVIWLAAGFVRTTPMMLANRAVADSRVVATIDRVVPIPSSRALKSINHFLQRNGFPRVFSGEREPVRGVGVPNSHVPKAVLNVSGSVAKVVASSPACRSGSEGSGWVTSNHRVVTNAHVVAGASRIAVQPRGKGPAHMAKLIAFDPARDVAVLHVDGLHAKPLHIRQRLSHGDSAVAAGFPGNGPYTLAPARVRRVLTARGLDIYGRHATQRRIYSLRATVQSGDSGGPLLDQHGRVAGMIFARSTAHQKTGYALTMHELEPVLKRSASQRAVSSGQCMQQSHG